MKKLSILFVATILAIAFTSCSSGRYVATSENINLNQTEVVLSQANFKVVKTVSTSILYKQSLKFDAEQLKQAAYAALLREAKLEGAQTIINVSFEQIQRVSGVIVPKQENAILVTGTVIEFTK